MKITCQACAAKYTIADEKVLGKIVKIRCKKCGASIVINGNDGTTETTGAPELGAADHAAKTAGGQGQDWTVNVAEGDQRPMTDAEVATAYRSGLVNDDTFCWKDGMPDWLALRDIPALVALSTGRGSATGATSASDDDAATKVQETPAFLLANSAPAASPAAARPSARPARPANNAGGNGSGAMHFPQAQTSAARRAGGRPPPAADLFGGAAQAGGEDDVMTSAPVDMPETHEDPQKMTGARNENSVLFSINALTSKGGVVAPQPMTATTEASGLIDIRQLSAQIGIGDDKKRSRVDDIMNLAGGGAFGPSLTSPMLAAPPADVFGPTATASVPAPSKSKELLFLALGAGVFVVVAAVGVALMLTHRGSDETADSKARVAASASEIAAVGSVPSANDSARPSASEAPPASAAPPTPTTTAAGATTKEPPKVAAGTAPKEATHATVAVPAAAGPETPFNMGEAKARLAAIAGNVQSCKKGDVSGTGRVVVVFAPNGGTQSANVTGPPFEGTPTGACVAVRFRGARVPPFGGSTFSVSKSFTIN